MFINPDQKKIPDALETTEEADYNLLGFFALLLEVDRRINPEHYKTNQDSYAGYSDNDN